MTGASPSRPGHHAAIATVIIALLFAAFICAMLIINYVGGRGADPLESHKLEQLKTQLAAEPANESLKQQIRQLDHELREDYFHRRALSARGAWLLLGGLVVFAATAKWLYSARRRPHLPEATVDETQHQRRALTAARWSVAGLGVLIVASAWIWAAGLPQPAPTVAPPVAPSVQGNWPRFRGPGGSGAAPYANAPTVWDGPSNTGVIWKTLVPLAGHNSPILWGNRVFCSGADSRRRAVFCFNAGTGKLMWERTIGDAPDSEAEVSEDDPFSAGAASPTMATDGQRVYAMFADGTLVCLTVEGQEVWSEALGPFDNNYGHATSLLCYNQTVIVQLDQATKDAGASELIAFDGASGDELWQATRPVSASWTTPIVARTPQGDQLITVADPWVIAYDPAKGDEIWRGRSVSGEIASSPVYTDPFVLVSSPGYEMIALRTDGRGDVTESHAAWTTDSGIPEITSPVTDGQYVWQLTGVLSCYNLADGKPVYEHELDMEFNASPSLAGGRLYLLSKDGVMLIVEAGGEYMEVGRCELGETTTASPAFADGRIYIRGRRNLFCIGGPSP